MTITDKQLEEIALTVETIADRVEHELNALRSTVSFMRHEASTDGDR